MTDAPETPAAPTLPTASESQLAKAAKLQDMWLDHMIAMFESGTITSTDMATLARVLLQNGWVLNATLLPKGLRDKLTKNVAFDDDHQPLRMVK